MARSVAQSCASIARFQHLGLILVGSLILPCVASAGAWTPPAGRVNFIVSASLSETPVADGAITTDLYYERGLGKGWTLVLSPSFSDQDNIFARNEAQISLRRSLYEDNGWALSAQAGAYIWKETASAEVSSGAEFRLALGKSIGEGHWVNFETAMRQCGGTNSYRWEGTLGYAVRRWDKAIVKVFGDSEGCSANITRVQASYVYGLSEALGVEVGLRQTLPNVGNWNERGLVVGLWVRF